MLQHHVAGPAEEAEPEQVLSDCRELSDDEGRTQRLCWASGRQHGA